MFRLLAAALLMAAPALAAEPAAPPKAKTVPMVETLHGTQLSDPYRWMEGKDPDYEPWLRAQNDHARARLAALPRRAELLKAIEARTGAIAGLSSAQRGGEWLFLARRPAGAQVGRLYVRSAAGGAERLLFDPATLPTDKGTHAINYWLASPDGRHAFIGVSPGGSEMSTLRVIETATGRFLPEEIKLALFNYSPEFPGGLYPHWLPDGSGFFYNRLRDGVKPSDSDFYSKSELWLHRLGTPVSSDRLVMRAGLDVSVPLRPADIPLAVAQPGSRHVVLTLAEGVSRDYGLFVAPLADVAAGKAKWRKLADQSDKVEGFALAGDSIYLLRRDSSAGRIVRVSASDPNLAGAQEVLPTGARFIERVIAASDGIYTVDRTPQGHGFRRISPTGTVETATLPFAGSSYGLSAMANQPGLLATLESYPTPRRLLRIAGARVEDTGLAPKPPFSIDAYMSESVLVTARDGTRVPLTIVRRRDLQKDGKRPVLLDAYGAYGISSDPYFNPRLLALLDVGAIYASASVRGGGELGADWYKAGYQATKHNTWRDAIDSAEWLAKSGWTEGKRITLWGTSAGGIMAGRAVTERPNLWGGVVASVGVMNPTRMEFYANGELNIPEFGSVKTADGFKNLLAMDPYHAVKDGTAYPPMLLTAGMNDSRVIHWQPAKFAARMQSATKGGPVLFKVDFGQGHGIGSTRSQIDNDLADIFAFTLWAAEGAR